MQSRTLGVDPTLPPAIRGSMDVPITPWPPPPAKADRVTASNTRIFATAWRAVFAEAAVLDADFVVKVDIDLAFSAVRLRRLLRNATPPGRPGYAWHPCPARRESPSESVSYERFEPLVGGSLACGTTRPGLGTSSRASARTTNATVVPGAFVLSNWGDDSREVVGSIEVLSRAAVLGVLRPKFELCVELQPYQLPREDSWLLRCLMHASLAHHRAGGALQAMIIPEPRLTPSFPWSDDAKAGRASIVIHPCKGFKKMWDCAHMLRPNCTREGLWAPRLAHAADGPSPRSQPEPQPQAQPRARAQSNSARAAGSTGASAAALGLGLACSW